VRLVISNKPTSKVDPMVADGFVATKMNTWVGRKNLHVAGARLPRQVSLEELVQLQMDLSTYIDKYNAELNIRTMYKTKDLVMYVTIPASQPESNFLSLVHYFKKALHDSGIMLDPLDCPLPAGLKPVRK
jgi:hypothetical protein